MTRKTILLLLVLAATALAAPAAKKAQKPLPYRDATLGTEARVADLLGRMTLQEKIGQLRCTLAWDYYDIQKDGRVAPSASFQKDIAEGNIGMLWATYRADPWTRKSLANGLTPTLAARCGNALQRYVLEHTRLGIPLFLAEEAPHGHMAIGTTVFPTGFGLAATWNPEVAEAMGRVVGKEVRLQGAHISYGPVMDLSRDPRWSRVEESMGEDPVLTAAIGSAVVRGLGGGDLSQPYSTIATLKHFIGYGTTEAGQNGGQSVLGQRDLLQNFFPPFRQAVKAGALSVMTSYNSLDGMPSSAATYMYRDILRRDWGFRGFVVSDLYSIDGIWETHHVARDLTEAGAMSLRAGVDADLGARAYGRLEEALARGEVTEAEIDTACARILRMKVEMGLFEHPYVDERMAAAVGSAQHGAVALKAAQQLITLLDNKHQTLPLSKTVRVAVVGPNADNAYNQLGDYTSPQPEGHVKTVLAGIRAKIGADRVVYAKGCAVRDTAGSDIPAAVAAARSADVVVAVVGGSSARDFKTNYKATGAAETDLASVSDMECGEGNDRTTLSLMGRQQELLTALRQTGKPLVVVYIEGRPLDKVWAAEHADALLTAYYPGQEGGGAIADVLFGDVNPAGRLPVTVVRSVGQIPLYYNKRPPVVHNYVETPAKPLYAFGHGLSYTTFEYSGLSIEQAGDRRYTVSFDVKNTGSREGDEVAQLYLHDEVASIAQPMMQLKHFARITLRPGESHRVQFTVDKTDLSLIGEDLKPVVEPGTFSVMVGAASDDIRLRGEIVVEK